MSGQYSTSVKVQYLQPRTHLNNTLTEFRLDQDTAYFPNLRLSNIGLTATAEQEHNELTGCYGCIKNIRLMDGSVEISATRHANRWLSFMAQRDHNQNNLCVHSKLAKAQVGYMLNKNDKVVYPIHVADQKIAVSNDATTDTDQRLGILDLRKVFPILQNLTILDTSLMRNLKVVIEWTVDTTIVSRAKDGAGFKVKEPELLCDQVMAEGAINALRKSQKSVVWDEIEHDQYNIPATANPADAGDSTVQTVSSVVNGFDNKYVSRMVMMKVPTDKNAFFSGDGGNSGAGNIAYGLGNFSSQNLHREKLQLRVNGANIFAGEGIKNDSQRAMLMSQSWGDLNILPFSHRQNVGLEDRSAIVQNSSGVPRLETDNKMSPRIGQSDYIGFSLEDKIRQLNFTHERTCLNNTLDIRTNEIAYDIHIFAECRKVLSLGSGGYKISYM